MTYRKCCDMNGWRPTQQTQVSVQLRTCTISVWTELLQGESSEPGPRMPLREGGSVETVSWSAFSHLWLLPWLLLKYIQFQKGPWKLDSHTLDSHTSRDPLLRSWGLSNKSVDFSP